MKLDVTQMDKREKHQPRAYGTGLVFFSGIWYNYKRAGRFGTSPYLLILLLSLVPYLAPGLVPGVFFISNLPPPWHTMKDMHRLPPWVRRHFLTISFIAGFITDVILLNQVEDVIDNLILLFYACLATLSIIFLYLATAEKLGETWSRRFRFLSPLAMQYSFGGLLSGMLIFYGRSGDWLASWPFFAIIAVVIIGNEMVRNRSQRLIFNFVTYFIGIFSYVVLVLPVFTGNFGPGAFLVSGFIALGIVYILIQIVILIIPNFMRLNMAMTVFALGITYLSFNALYFLNVIPPIPLALKEITIAHSVQRTDSAYVLIYEPSPRWQVWRRVHDVFHPSDSNEVSCFTRIFAPSRIGQLDIAHIWEFRNREGRWQEHFRLSYPITAVGDRGFRGYTTISNFSEGEWRCKITTSWGQVLGQQRFTIDRSIAPELVRRVVE